MNSTDLAPPDFGDVSRVAFDIADPAGATHLCTLLAKRIATLFQRNTEPWPHTTAYSAIDALRLVGHDLWSFDEDGQGSQAWCGDYSRPEPSQTELIVEFRMPDRVEVTWLRGNPKAIVASAVAGSTAERDAG